MNPTKYGQRVQYAEPILLPSALRLSPKQLQRLQAIIGTFRFNADSVDSTLQMPVSSLLTDASHVSATEINRTS